MSDAIDNLLNKLLVRKLREVADKIESGILECSSEERQAFLDLISHEPVSKEEACSYIKLNRSRFDDYVRIGVIPPGRKRKWFKELVWYKDELDKANVIIKNKTNR